MNLNHSPNATQLRDLLKACDDDAGNHIIWVDRHGEVHITLLASDLTPAEWAISMQEELQFRYETLGAANGYVGPQAASDDEYVASLLRDLIQDWEKGARGYLGN